MSNQNTVTIKFGKIDTAGDSIKFKSKSTDAFNEKIKRIVLEKE